MNKIYLAAPFFNDAQNNRISAVKHALEQNPTVANVFEPAKHSYKNAEFGTLEWQKAAFGLDTSQIVKADAVVAIIDYKLEDSDNEADSGTAFEIGFAYGTRTPIIIVQFDPEKEINLMIRQAMTAYFDVNKNGLTALSNYDFDELMPAFVTDRPVI
ncbi:nucleoside 2-deoxyribosyltransferase [Ligilactobacillus sp. WILCCON 0076]|uniref:Nucleoside 2-deoxyribosyltransferase n=1 Tax=Ligilactobacillus ubinensis TaxID=2876789 RepID=A0A9X2JLR3_9LACO|nr:nucleoside 2-deoxyribosyltransferase [Ligilactobacillus ubinensis]MCP0887174.1 nucleoside 2-deoxyribosyltransferase [Ligilactobacillus ubinensis]